MERYVSGDLNIISRTHWPEKWYIKSTKKANYQMTCCPTSHFLRTNASPFEVDKKEDKIGEYWVSQHVAPLKVHRHTVLPDFEFHRNVFGQLDPLPTPTVSEIQLFQCLYLASSG